MTALTIQWFAFRAYNSQTVYGSGTAAEASLYEDILNEGKEINLYHATALTDAEVADLGLEDSDEGVSLEDELRAHEEAQA